MHCNTVNVLTGKAEVFILSMKCCGTILSYKFNFLLCALNDWFFLLSQLLYSLKYCKFCIHIVFMCKTQGLAKTSHHEFSKTTQQTSIVASVAQHISAMDVMQSSLSFFFTMFGSRVAQGAFIPTLFPYFLQVLPYMTLIFRENFFTPSLH